MTESNSGAIIPTELKRRTGKKARYSSSQKRELQDLKRKQEAETTLEPSKKRKRSRSQSQSQSKTSKRDKLDRLLKCAEECLFTDSIVVENHDEFEAEGSSNENDNENENENNNASPQSNTLVVRIVTGGDRPKSESASPSTLDSEKTGDSSAKMPPPMLPPLSSPGHRVFTRRTTIFVRPLLVLDLNGILCHRDRTRKRPDGLTSGDLRPSVGTIAQTPVVPRSDLKRFLRYLDEHFCLAVWTSARPKTAQCLLNALLGGYYNDDDDDGAAIRRRFLFVWSQKQCNAVRSGDRQQPTGGRSGGDGDDAGGVANNNTNSKNNNNNDNSFDDTIYEKHLPKIWRSYPLWSANNTLLMDDSPEKIPQAVSNAVHPPPLDGRLIGGNDASNEALQMTFFEALVKFWRKHEHGSAPWKATASGTSREEHTKATELTHCKYRKFLKKHATGHMGWRAPPA